jgi:hypothetical protein
MEVCNICTQLCQFYDEPTLRQDADSRLCDHRRLAFTLSTLVNYYLMMWHTSGACAAVRVVDCIE